MLSAHGLVGRWPAVVLMLRHISENPRPGFLLGSGLGSRGDPLWARRRACASRNRTPSISLAPRINSKGAGYKVSISSPHTSDNFLSPHSLRFTSSSCLEAKLSSCETYDKLPSALARSLPTPSPSSYSLYQGELPLSLFHSLERV